MSNPWTKKNPLMSLWLSGANAVAGSARAHATAAVRREAARTTTQGLAAWAELWSGGLAAPRPKPRRRRTRR